MKTTKAAGRVQGLWVLLVVLAGLLLNLGSARPAECDRDAPYTVTLAGDGQTGAATAPLGQALSVRVTCRPDTGGDTPIGAEGVLTEWTVLTGGGRVDGRATVAKRTAFGDAAVLWQLGPEFGEQTVTMRVGGRLHTFKATAGGATAGGTCTGGAGTDFAPLVERTISGDETWPLAGSPYRGGRVVVGTGATLTIEAGVTACLDDLWVKGNGQLRAEGTAALPVEMAPARLNGAWSAGFFRDFAPPPDVQRRSTLRHVNLRHLATLQVVEAALQIEDSRLEAPPGAGLCPTVRWVLPPPATAGDSAVRRSVFDGFGGGPGCFGDPAGVSFEVPAALAAEPMPFQARVLRSAGDGVRLTGKATAAVALSNCEIAGSARDGLVVDDTGTAAPAAVSGCNFTGNARFAVRNARVAAPTVDARGNWWGDPAGAPTAGGNAVSAGVDADNPAVEPFVLGY